MLRSRIFFLLTLFIIQPIIVAQAAVVQPKPIAERDMLVEPASVKEVSPRFVLIVRMDGTPWACPPSNRLSAGSMTSIKADTYEEICVSLETILFKGVVQATPAMLTFEVVRQNRAHMRCLMENMPQVQRAILSLPADSQVNIQKDWLSSCAEVAASPST